MLVKTLAFTSVYFFESSLFNGLRPIGVKKIGRASAPALVASIAPLTLAAIALTRYSDERKA
jgi:hypothetical protein